MYRAQFLAHNSLNDGGPVQIISGGSRDFDKGVRIIILPPSIPSSFPFSPFPSFPLSFPADSPLFPFPSPNPARVSGVEELAL